MATQPLMIDLASHAEAIERVGEASRRWKALDHKALHGGGLSQAEEAERARVAGICELEGAHVLNQLAHLVRAARG